MKAGMAAAAAIALVATLTAGHASANGMAYGYGAQGCGKFVEATDQKKAGDSYSSDLFMSWMAGFASYSSGLSGSETLKGTDATSVQLWLENYCRAHPLERFFSAVTHLLQELAEK